MKTKLLLILCIVVCLAGCVQTRSEDYNLQQASIDNAQIQLAEAATSVSKDLNQLAAIEKAKMPKSSLQSPPSPASIGMAQLASTDWTGPIEQLMQKIAKASNYRLQIIGRKPAIPVIVSVSAENEPLATILRDTSFQAAKKVDVVVYPRRRIIEMRYLR